MSALERLPPIAVEVDGAALPEAALGALARVRVQQLLSAPAVCELRFFSSDIPAAPAPELRPGAKLRVRTGERGEELFAGEATAIEYVYDASHGRETRVRAYDALHRLRKRQPVRAHVQVTLADLAREMVAGLGLSVRAGAAGPLWQRVFQYGQTDLELLTELAERCGEYLALRGDALCLMTLAGAGDAVALTLGENLFEARVELNGDPACREVQAAGWDASFMRPHRGRAGAARLGRNVAAAVNPGDLGGVGERTFVGEGAMDDTHADALAQAELDSRMAREVTFWGVAQGDARLRPGTPLEVRGLSAGIEGRYVATSVIHTIARKTGFISEVSTAPPALRPRPRGAATAPGTVIAVNDPEGLGRVRVALAAYGDLETGWMGVVSPGAGAGKGFMMLPDVGDQVLVLFAHEDPAQGVVLGSLYGATKPPDAGVESSGIRRFTLLTPGGQRVRLDDVHNTIRVEDRKGSYLELSPEHVLLHAEADLTLEAPGRSIAIQAKKIDFRSA